MHSYSDFLDPLFQQDISDVMDTSLNHGGTQLRYEHLAVCEIGEGTMRTDLESFLERGYQLIKDAGDVIFIAKAKDDALIELIPHDFTEHVGYIVPYGRLGASEYRAYVEYFSKQTNGAGMTWRLIESDANEERSYAMFMHVSTGLHLQLLHRERSLLPGVWS